MTGSNCRHPRCKRGALPTELIARAQISRVFRTAPQVHHAPVAVRRAVGVDRDDPQPFRWWAAVWHPTVSHAGRARWRCRTSRSAMSRAVSSFRLTCRTKLVDLKAKPIRSLALSDSAMPQNLMPQGLIAAGGFGAGPKEDREGVAVSPPPFESDRNRQKNAGSIRPDSAGEGIGQRFVPAIRVSFHRRKTAVNWASVRRSRIILHCDDFCPGLSLDTPRSWP